MSKTEQLEEIAAFFEKEAKNIYGFGGFFQECMRQTAALRDIAKDLQVALDHYAAALARQDAEIERLQRLLKV